MHNPLVNWSRRLDGPDTSTSFGPNGLDRYADNLSKGRAVAYDAGLAQRVREALGERPGLSERKMFGGLAFLVDGKMFVGVLGSTLMARVGPERHQDALARPHVREMDFTGRPMKGYVFIDPPGLEDDRELGAWVSWCAAYVGGLPLKKSK
jgi:hypothetical protein